jgi:nicotinamidase-related amidase
MTQTALLVIDLQRGAFDSVRCPPVDRAPALIHHAVALVDAARLAGVPVVFVQHCQADAGAPFEEGTTHGQLHEALRPQSGDTVLKKIQSSAFDGTDLADRLQALAAGELVVCGLQSEFCVSNTTRSALALGLGVLVAEDAHSTWPSNGLSAEAIAANVNRDLRAAGATLRSTRELILHFPRSAGMANAPSAQF